MWRLSVHFAGLWAALILTASPLAAGWQVEFYGGSHFPSASDLSLERPAAGDRVNYRRVNWADKSFDSPIYYGYRILRWFGRPQQNGLEVELIHAKVYSDPRQSVRAQGTIAGERVDEFRLLGERLERFQLSHGLNFLLVNLVRRYHLIPGRPSGRQCVQLVFRVGVGACISHTESTVDGIPFDGYEFGGIGLQAAAGITVPLTGRFYLPAEYKYTRSRLRGLKLHLGSAGADIGASHLALGLGVSF